MTSVMLLQPNGVWRPASSVAIALFNNPKHTSISNRLLSRSPKTTKWNPLELPCSKLVLATPNPLTKSLEPVGYASSNFLSF